MNRDADLEPHRCDAGYIPCPACAGAGDPYCLLCEGDGDVECECALAQENANAAACGQSRTYLADARRWG